jgi:hypothetical protein
MALSNTARMADMLLGSTHDLEMVMGVVLVGCAALNTYQVEVVDGVDMEIEVGCSKFLAQISRLSILVDTSVAIGLVHVVCTDYSLEFALEDKDYKADCRRLVCKQQPVDLAHVWWTDVCLVFYQLRWDSKHFVAVEVEQKPISRWWDQTQRDERLEMPLELHLDSKEMAHEAAD